MNILTSGKLCLKDFSVLGEAGKLDGGTTNGTGKRGRGVTSRFLTLFLVVLIPQSFYYEKMIHNAANSFSFFLILTKGIPPLLPPVEFLLAD